ncbi:8-oxo-dGTP diphosphatase [Nocardiopsis mwathae]|uniref:8-oxo-dGTP diphosphatase n=1 Tax=Nocardiopsis mwathae TaxID=1472723 RepID=A0A7X0D6V1_9ACTN|nr:NUDIX domain-containing protein [Nocardiopsis mwathae]MBB6173645.1 8-oxo-dGTP diphosphatase [Nocardiopsis mwathae]
MAERTETETGAADGIAAAAGPVDPSAYVPDEATITSAFPPRDTAPAGYMEPIRAAGAVLWRDVDGADGHGKVREVALIHRPDRRDWTLPKGKVKNGEHLLTAAVREVTEETGLRPVLGRRIPPQRYLKSGWPKQVEWWAATSTGPSMFSPNDEVDALQWLPIAEARRRLSYDHDIQVLDNIVCGPLETFPVILMRHASAGEKKAWADSDLLRPLDEVGRADALELAEVLAAFGAPRVVSSAAARCTETMLPYAVANGAQMRTERAFTVQTFDRANPVYDRKAAHDAFADLLQDGQPTVVCTHGELVTEMMRDALGRLGAPVTQQLSLRKGTFWVVHVSASDRTLAAIERHTVRG